MCEADTISVVLFPFYRLGGGAPTRDVQGTRQPLYVITLWVEESDHDLVFSTIVLTCIYVQIFAGASNSPRQGEKPQSSPSVRFIPVGPSDILTSRT